MITGLRIFNINFDSDEANESDYFVKLEQLTERHKHKKTTKN